ncbi:MAG: hypothetical protein DLM69_00830, partial [Candidatus Chloroheliales bacterium]
MTTELLAVIAAPAFGGLLAIAFRRQPLVQVVSAAAALLLQLILSALVTDGQYNLGSELILRVGPIERFFIAAADIPIVATLLYHARVADEGRKFVAVAMFSSAAVSAVALVEDSFVAAFALLIASVALAVGLVDEPLRVVETPPGSAPLPPVRPFAAALRYLSLSVFAAIALGFALILLASYTISPDQPALLKVTFAFLVVGLALRLGAAPFHLWLPSLLDPARGSGLIGLLSVGALSGGTVLFAAHILLDNPPLLLQDEFGRAVASAGALGSAMLGGLLALAQGERRRRCLAYLFISDAGLLLFGLVSGTAVGFSASLATVLGYSLAAPLMLLSFNLLGDGNFVARAGLLIGGLSLVGLVPTYGFAARWLLYTAAAQLGPGWLLAALAAVLLMLAAAVRSF